MEKNENSMDEQMEKVSGGQITTNIEVKLTGDDALDYLKSDLYSQSRNNNNNNARTAASGFSFGKNNTFNF